MIECDEIEVFGCGGLVDVVGILLWRIGGGDECLSFCVWYIFMKVMGNWMRGGDK